MNPSFADKRYQRELAQRGAFLEYDMIGMSYYYADESAQSPSDEENARAIRELIDDGYIQQILLSQDVFLKTMLTRYGGHGYGYILKHFVPRLRRHGVSGEQLTTGLQQIGRYLNDWKPPAGLWRIKGNVIMQKKILLVGESWTSTSTHVKGFDQFATATWHTGATDFLAALADSPYAITYMPAHAAATDFPLTLEALQEWDAIILSDIGANTLLLHPDTWLESRRTANRLTLLHDYVAGGGALMMIGGYYSFQGINGGARYRHTEVEKVLPVCCLAWDDRIETPEGCYAEVTESHPLFNDIPGEWPWLLGYNEVEMHPEGKLLATVAGTGHPLLAVREYQQGRSLVWTSDMSAHWLPEEFAKWPGYRQLWINCLDWLTERR